MAKMMRVSFRNIIQRVIPWPIRMVCCLFPFALQGHLPEIPDTLPPFPLNEELFQQRIESLAEEGQEETDFSALIEGLEMLLQHPINLNHATEEDLRKLFFLNEIQIRNLIDHINQNGKLLNILELQSVEGFDRLTIQAIQPYISISDSPFPRNLSFREVLHQGQHQYFLRWQRQMEKPRGFTPVPSIEQESDPKAVYPGSPYRLYTRYRFTCHNNFSIGFTAEKDPGERFFGGGQPNGFDYYSGHAFFRDMGRVKAAVVGDYQLQFGQGVTFWSGLSFGKSSDAIAVHKFAQGIRPHTSVDENLFLRGAGICLALGSFELTTFASAKRRDANILERDSMGTETLVITSLQQTGLHRTSAELEDKHAVREAIFGGHLAWERPSFSIGLTAIHVQLEAAFYRDLSFYNQFDFSGNHNDNLGCDYSFSGHNFHFFGETGLSANGEIATLNGLILSLDPRLSVSLLHRYFSRDYQALYASAFGENTRVVNEQGLYLGISAHLSPRWHISACADHFEFPWMKYRTYFPSLGFEYQFQINFQARKTTEIYLRYRIRNKPINTSQATALIYPEDAIRQTLRFHSSHEIMPGLTLRNRIEYSHYHHNQQKEQGYTLYQDVIWHHSGRPWALTARFALFDTGGYDSRIYAYENDVLYAFSFPFYYRRGIRAYALFRYRLNPHIDLYGRLARTFFTQPASENTGPDAVNENTRTEIKLQIRARF